MFFTLFVLLIMLALIMFLVMVGFSVLFAMMAVAVTFRDRWCQ